MVVSWNDWWLAHNSLGYPTTWDPANNPAQLVKSEISDTYKAMSKIRALEYKLKNWNAPGTTNADWNMLNSLKREVGIPVEFAKDETPKVLGGEGNVPSKAVSANV